MSNCREYNEYKAGEQRYNDGCKLQLFQKNNYFYGKLLSVRDFKTEQEYLDGKRHLINHSILKPGIIYGLYYETNENKEKKNDNIIISKEKSGGDIKIKIQEGGAALDCCGNEIVVPDKSKKTILIDKEKNGNYVPLTEKDLENRLFLFLKVAPCLTEPVSAVTELPECIGKYNHNRTAEDFMVIASAEEPEMPDVDNSARWPDFSEIATEEGYIRELKKWINRAMNRKEPHTQDPKVFLSAIDKNLKIDKTGSIKYRTYVYNNRLLHELVIRHMCDFKNPHNTTGSGMLKVLTHIEEIGWNHEETINSDTFTKKLYGKKFYIQFPRDVIGVDENSFKMAVKIKIPHKVEAVNQFASNYYYWYLNGKVDGLDKKGNHSKNRYVFFIDKKQIDVDLQALFSYLYEQTDDPAYQPPPIPVVIQIKCDFIRDATTNRIILRPSIEKKKDTYTLSPYVDNQNVVQGGIFESWFYVKLLS